MVSGRCLILDDIRGMGLIMININEAIINQYDTTDHEMKIWVFYGGSHNNFYCFTMLYRY